MRFITCHTNEITDKHWESYIRNFNKTFDKNFTKEYFKSKYLHKTQEQSYHSFLLNDADEVVGAYSAIPIYYYRQDERIKSVVTVDTFVAKDYRKNNYWFNLYTNLKEMLILDNVILVASIPNDNSYQKAKKIFNRKDIGKLNYWILPVNIANVLHSNIKFLNIFSKIYANAIVRLSSLFSIFNIKEKAKKYRIDINCDYYKYRFENAYKTYKDKDVFFAYKLYEEEGVKTAYVIDARSKGKRSFNSLRKAILAILKNEEVDLIIFVGSLGFCQTMLLKIPNFLEPKRLNLLSDLLSKDEKFKDMYNINNWDFSLLNFDVR